MKSLLCLVAVLLALAAAGCGGDDGKVPVPTFTGRPLDPALVALSEWEWHRAGLERYSFVRGRVVGPDGEPFESATVTLCVFPPYPVQPPFNRRSVTTDASGNFQFEDVPAIGRVIVEAPDLVSMLVPVWMLLRRGERPLQMMLRSGGAIEGTLRRLTNEPVAGHKVWGRGGDPEWFAVTTTDEEGRFRLAPAPAGPVIIGPLRQGRMGGVERSVTVARGNTAQADLLVREMPPIVGQVVDRDTGDPIPRALVLFVSDREHVIVADEEGRFRIEADSLPNFAIRADGYGESMLAVDPGRVEEQRVQVRLGPGGRISGRVLDEDGRPVAGTRMKVIVDPDAAGSMFNGPLTDEEGRFAFTWIPLAQNGGQVILLTDSADRHPAVAEAVRLVPGQAIEDVELTLERPESVSFRVVDENGGPMRYALVEMEWLEGPRSGPVASILSAPRSSISDEEGRVRVTGLRRGLQRLRVFAPRRMAWSTDVKVEGRAGEDLGDILVPRGLAVAGRVESLGGSALPPDTRLILSGSGGGPREMLELEPDGTFLLEGLEAGSYFLRVEARGHEAAGVQVEAGRRDILLRPRSLGELRLNLVRPEGVEEEGRIELRALSGTAVRREPHRRTVPAGESAVVFERVFAGKYRIRVLLGGFYALREIVVPSGPPVTVELGLSRGCDVEGHVFLPDGEPARFVGVDYEAGQAWGGMGVRTDGQGRFEFGGIPPGEIKVRSQPVGYPPEVKTVRVRAGESASCELRLRRGGRLRVQAFGPYGKPLVGAVAVLSTADGAAVPFWVEGGQSARTNAEGELVLTGIAPGELRLVVAHSGKQSEPREVRIVGGELQKVRVDFEE